MADARTVTIEPEFDKASLQLCRITLRMGKLAKRIKKFVKKHPSSCGCQFCHAVNTGTGSYPGMSSDGGMLPDALEDIQRYLRLLSGMMEEDRPRCSV